MKHLTLIIISALITLSCKAQSSIVGYNTFSVPDNAYCKDLNNDLDKFTGTWKYVDGNTELTTVIEKEEQVFNGDYYIDKLRGQYKYIKDGVEVINTLSNDMNLHPVISGTGLWDNNSNIFELGLRDPDKLRATYKLTLKFLGNSSLSAPIKMEWSLMQTGFYGSYVPGETPPTATELDQTIRLPINVVLIKQ